MVVRARKKKVAVKENTEGKTDKSKTQETSGYEQKKKKTTNQKVKERPTFIYLALKTE